MPGHLRGQRLAEVVQERAAAGHLDVRADLGGEGGGELGGLHEVLEHVLPVGRAQAQPTQRADERRVQPAHAGALGGVVPGRVGALVGAGERLGVGLLDALRVDATVRHEGLEGDLGDLAALGVEAGQDHGVGLVVDEDVHAGQRLEGPDVAALLADDPALHLVGRERQDGERRLRAGRDGEPLDRRGDDAPRPGVRGPARLGLGASDLRGRVVLRLLDDPPGQLGAGVVRREAGDRLELGERGLLGRRRAGCCRALRLLQQPRARSAAPRRPPRPRRGLGVRARRPRSARSRRTARARSAAARAVRRPSRIARAASLMEATSASARARCRPASRGRRGRARGPRGRRRAARRSCRWRLRPRRPPGPAARRAAVPVRG